MKSAEKEQRENAGLETVTMSDLTLLREQALNRELVVKCQRAIERVVVMALNGDLEVRRFDRVTHPIPQETSVADWIVDSGHQLAQWGREHRGFFEPDRQEGEDDEDPDEVEMEFYDQLFPVLINCHGDTRNRVQKILREPLEKWFGQ